MRGLSLTLCVVWSVGMTSAGGVSIAQEHRGSNSPSEDSLPGLLQRARAAQHSSKWKDAAVSYSAALATAERSGVGGVYALACAGEIFHGGCRDPGTTCVPTAEPPPPGFRQCIAWRGEGEPACPGTYPEPFTFYAGLEDTRECTPCECSEAIASDCIAQFTIYGDPTCTALLDSSMMNLGGIAPCKDIGMSGADLRSMNAMWIANEPGKCMASGGLPQGDATPTNPKTFCCQPPP
jgi:hypothetical protein